MNLLCKPNGRFVNDTKENILKASFGLFLKKSYKEVTIKEIVDATGISKGAIYHYFPGKEELFKEVVETYFLKGLDTNFERIPKHNLKLFINSCLQNLVDMIDKLKKNFGLSNSRQGVTYYSRAFEILRMFPEFEKLTDQQHQLELNTWKEVISNSRNNGEIDTAMSDAQLAKLFVVVNDGLSVKLIMTGRIDDLAGEMFTLYNSLYNMVKR